MKSEKEDYRYSTDDAPPKYSTNPSSALKNLPEYDNPPSAVRGFADLIPETSALFSSGSPSRSLPKTKHIPLGFNAEYLRSSQSKFELRCQQGCSYGNWVIEDGNGFKILRFEGRFFSLSRRRGVFYHSFLFFTQAKR